jgi:Phage tail-collar fibre protein
MQFEITNTGYAAAFAASNQGPAIKIAAFAIGAGVGYVPLVTDTSLRGIELYRSTPSAYQVLDDNSCEFTLRMDETVGSWQFGEVALLFADGTVFAIGTLQRPQWKVAYPDADFNRYNVKVRLVLSGAIPKIELVATTLVAGVIWELPSVDKLPLAADAQTNAYLCHSTDDNGNDALSTLGSRGWTIASHMRRVARGTLTSKLAGGFGCSASGLVFNDVIPGKYLIQFISGTAKGSVRSIISMGGGQCTWSLPELNSTVGTQYELLQSNSGGDAGDAAFFYSLMGR